jgi:hypothetical protein
MVVVEKIPENSGPLSLAGRQSVTVHSAMAQPKDGVQDVTRKAGTAGTQRGNI